MKRSLGLFLVFFIVMVAAGAGLISLIPAAIGPSPTVQTWIPPVFGAVFAASAFVAWKVRPKWERNESTRH